MLCSLRYFMACFTLSRNLLAQYILSEARIAFRDLLVVSFSINLDHSVFCVAVIPKDRLYYLNLLYSEANVLSVGEGTGYGLKQSNKLGQHVP